MKRELGGRKSFQRGVPTLRKERRNNGKSYAFASLKESSSYPDDGHSVASTQKKTMGRAFKLGGKERTGVGGSILISQRIIKIDRVRKRKS